MWAHVAAPEGGFDLRDSLVLAVLIPVSRLAALVAYASKPVGT